MKAQQLKILIGTARADLKSAYEAQLDRPGKFDGVLEAYLHCRHVAGVDSRFGNQIDVLEGLEAQLDELENTVLLPKWRARRVFMRELVAAGAIRGSENVERAAAFMQLIDDRLAGDDNATTQPPDEDASLLNLLHPVIVESSWSQFRGGHLRDAVLNAFIAIGDLIRLRTGLQQDGKALAEQALSLQKPLLVLSNLETESGKNDQLGFMHILSGAFLGIRNPKAHSMQHDLDTMKAAQYLIFASLLARRFTEAVETSRDET